MPSQNISVYIKDEDYPTFLKKKDEIMEKIKDLIEREVKKK